MLTIRLTRTGKKNSPSYRVVVADKKRAVKRKFIEIIGNYNPAIKPKQLVIDKDRALFWIQRGAQASDTVNNLMVDLGILAKDKKIKKIYAKKMSKKVAKEGPKVTAAPVEKATTEEAPEEKVTEEEAVVAKPEATSEEAVAETLAEETVSEESEADNK
jgi:small subunit ribosomal protein S16